jgi:hypothetical protein
MKARTYILLALALGLMLFILLVERKMPTTEEGKAQAKKILNVKEDEITGLKFSSPESSWEAKKDNGKWRLASPMDTPADEGTIGPILTALAGLESEKDLEAGADLKAMDLQPAKTTLPLATARGPLTLSLGASIPGTTRMALLRQDTGRGYLIANALTGNLRKSLTELRAKEIFTVDSARVAAIELTKGGRTTTVKKSGDGWTLDFPFPDRADREGVDDLLFGFSGLRAKEFVDTFDAARLKALGLDPPTSHIAFYDKDNKALLDASVGRPATLGKDEFYILTGKRIFLTSQALWSKLEQGALAFPDPKLLGLKRWEVDHLDMTVGTVKKTLERKENDWWVNGKKAGAAGIDDLLDHLAALQWMENYKTPKMGAVEIRAALKSGKNTIEAEIAPDAADPKFWWAKVTGRPNFWKLEESKITMLKDDFGKIAAEAPKK